MTLHVPGYRPDGRSFFIVVAGGALPVERFRLYSH